MRGLVVNDLRSETTCSKNQSTFTRDIVVDIMKCDRVKSEKSKGLSKLVKLLRKLRNQLLISCAL